jgi:hypothetical protein
MPRGSISDEKGIDKIGEEGEREGERLHPDLTFFGPRTLILKVIFYECRYYFLKEDNIQHSDGCHGIHRKRRSR